MDLLFALKPVQGPAAIRSRSEAVVQEQRGGDTLKLRVLDSAIFTNFLGLKNRLAAIPHGVRKVVVDFENAWVVAHTVLETLHRIEAKWGGCRENILQGFGNRRAWYSHNLAGAQ
jgi:hypothetical protein